MADETKRVVVRQATTSAVAEQTSNQHSRAGRSAAAQAVAIVGERAIRSLAVTALLATALVPDLAAAQASAGSTVGVGLAPGARVRVTMPWSGPLIGTVVAVTRDTLVARWAPGDSGTVALAQVAKLEVSRGRRGEFWRGVRIGALAGATLGAAFGVMVYEPCEAWCMGIESRGAAAVAGAILFGTGGVVVGGVAGALSRTDIWQEVTPAPGRVGIAVPPRGLGAGVAFAF